MTKMTQHDADQLLEILTRLINDHIATDDEIPDELKQPTTAQPSLLSCVKVGQWVGKVSGIFGEPTTIEDISEIIEIRGCLVKLRNQDGEFFEHMSTVKHSKPIRFRPYTYEEAKTLLGKVMECCYDGKRKAILINCIFENEDGWVYTNNETFANWQEYNATIDGLPIGVPEVDEWAMKGGAECV